MRVLLDENLPVDLVAILRGHEVDTVVGLGWSGITNGELLRRAAGDYQALVTMDRNIQHQQNLGALSFGIVLVRARSNRMIHLDPLVPEMLAALASLRPGELRLVGAERG